MYVEEPHKNETVSTQLKWLITGEDGAPKPRQNAPVAPPLGGPDMFLITSLPFGNFIGVIIMALRHETVKLTSACAIMHLITVSIRIVDTNCK